MRRLVFRRTATGMALFPFLAVLICTMGALIVLLVLILQQSRAQASVASSEQQAADAERRADDQAAAKQRREQLQDLEWRSEVLEQQRTQQSEDLARSRLELSHLEDHIRRLQDQAKRLGAEVEQSGAEQTDEEQQKLSEQMKKLQDEIAAARQKLAAAQLAANQKNKSFTIIPYEGRSGTRRRPIYIECAEEGIILHPENIVFQPNDFDGPLGPGNPLDAALRTVREYLARYGNRDEVGEPYPLLVVRPNGAIAYSMARAAMKSWDDEFGYELIDGETNLQFPPADPQLEQLLLRTIKDARQRQVALAAAMPSRYKAAHASTTEETVSAQSFAAAQTSPSSPTTSAGNHGLGAGHVSNGMGNGPAAGRGPGKGSGTGGGTASGTGKGTETGTGTGTGTGSGGGTGSGVGRGDGSGSSDGTSASGAQGYAAAGSSGSSGTGGPAGAGAASGGAGNSAGGTSGNGGAGGGGGGGPNGGAAMPGQFGSPGGTSLSMGNGSGVAPAASLTAGGGPNDSGSGSTGTAGTSGSTSNEKSRAGGTSGSSGRGTGGGKFSQSGAAAHADGEWALPAKSQFSTAITRPIRVRCEPKRLVILPEKGDAKRAKVVPVPGPSGAALDDFVIAIRKHMDGWGLAVRGGYWKPVLNVTVAPGAESQFSELESALHGSGIEVVRK